jgi:hypothetical protein
MTNYPDNYVEIEIGHVVKLRVGLSTYLFTPEDYAAIAAAIFNTPPADNVWQARITEDMVSELTDTESMIEELDDYVAGTAMEYGVN